MPDARPPGHTIGAPAGRGNDARRALAAAGEQLAAAHLQRLGYVVLARNHRTRLGEIDIVATDARTLVFVEVKTRRASRSARPFEALDDRKRRQVRRMAAIYLTEEKERPHGLNLRFDAIGVIIDPRGRLVALDHLEGAF